MNSVLYYLNHTNQLFENILVKLIPIKSVKILFLQEILFLFWNFPMACKIKKVYNIVVARAVSSCYDRCCRRNSPDATPCPATCLTWLTTQPLSNYTHNTIGGYKTNSNNKGGLGVSILKTWRILQFWMTRIWATLILILDIVQIFTVM